ncbi:helix-turn-helix domain-containing protein [Peptostreptococcus canis]|uniref:Helix-turn-helix domain-containing protein n=1 Tax=Peptostreptococcus canis TaxID=1159213 RepID=A0ABR6TIB7_9FIRM|nr:helix-turn-helix domain-containing protein [Peptostreptococcus canis]MBC2575160.1 helix-turn-helix domain-containing protein [Peptostreptococcus canis]MBP1997665.1 transcriptional regulator with XRE-family HTH domain [Peptostreptococcus canis]
MNIIRYFRKKNGYSQKYLSESLDVSRTTITRFENMSDEEILSKISLEQFNQLCEVLNMEPEFINYKCSSVKPMNIYNLKNRKKVTSNENIENYILIDKNLIDADYTVKIESKDNILYNIFPNYFVLIKACSKIIDGKLFVIKIPNSEPILRRCYVDKFNENKIIIIAGNKNIPPIDINREEISVMGIVVGVFFNA